MGRRIKNRILLALFIAIALSSCTHAETIYVAVVDGVITAGTAQYLIRVIGEAEEAQADILIVTVDTPGGLVSATEDIVDAFTATDVDIVVYVEEGGWAYSAGTYLLMAADVAACHPDATIGAAEPQPAENKTRNAMAAWMATLAESHGRNTTAARSFVTENTALSGRDALSLGVIDQTSPSREALLEALSDGKVIASEHPPTLLESLYIVVAHPQLASLLVMLGVLGAVFAVRTGEESAIVVAALALLVGLWAMGSIEYSVMGVALLVAGIAFLALEASQPGFGVFGVAGMIATLLGIFSIDAEPFYQPRLADDVVLFVLGVAALVCLAFIFILRTILAGLHYQSNLGPERFIGDAGWVTVRIAPRGKVHVKGESWPAVSADGNPIDVDATVRIIEVKDDILHVSAIKEDAR